MKKEGEILYHRTGALRAGRRRRRRRLGGRELCLLRQTFGLITTLSARASQLLHIHSIIEETQKEDHIVGSDRNSAEARQNTGKYCFNLDVHYSGVCVCLDGCHTTGHGWSRPGGPCSPFWPFRPLFPTVPLSPCRCGAQWSDRTYNHRHTQTHAQLQQ